MPISLLIRFIFYIRPQIYKLFYYGQKEIIKIVIKVLLYILTLIGGYFGVTSLSSCTIQRKAQITGKAVVVTIDTTTIHHEGSLELKSK